MTGSDGWLPFGERVPMVPERYAVNTGIQPGQMYPQVIVDHVMGGHYSYALEMMRDQTVGDDPDDYASWHFSIARDGRVAQHADIWTPTWGAGLRATDVTQEPISAFRKRWSTNPNGWTVHTSSTRTRPSPRRPSPRSRSRRRFASTAGYGGSARG